MTYYINGRFLTQKMTGIQRFALQMCIALHQNGVDICVIMPHFKLKENHFPFKIIEYGKNIGPLWEQICLSHFLHKHPNATLISFSGIGPVFAKRHITTIHDLSFFVNKHWFSFLYRLYYKIMTPLLVKHCTAIITVSEFSKKEIIKYLKVKPEKITVIYNAVSETFLTPCHTITDYRFKRPFILAVSSLDPRKNFKTLVRAFETSNITTHKLYIIGTHQSSFSSPDIECKSDRIEFLGHVDDDILKQAYSSASLFVYPSLYEGFGIPPIEAMSLGCPVLLSDIEVFHEINGDAALYCSPTSEDDIIKKIKFALDFENKSVIDDLKISGLKKSRNYSWAASGLKLKQTLLK